MSFAEFLHENETAFLSRWTDVVLSTYPAEARPFLEGKDRFANPLGYNLTQGLRRIYRSLRGEEDDVDAYLEQMMKIMAVQDRSPSAAVSFLFALKEIVRGRAGGQDEEDLAAWSATVDNIALKGFDFYVRSRERLFNARLRELSSGNHLLTRHGCPSALLDKNDAAGVKSG